MTTTLPLSSITRISPLNPRRGIDDVAQLAATFAVVGLKQDLIVWPTPGQPGEYEVLDGGRRWRALTQLAAEGGPAPRNLRDFDAIPVEIHEGDEVSARLVALAVSTTSRPLHPVDDYEAFSELVDAGMRLADVAKVFHVTEKIVRQRLALASLAPRVREMWRKGEMSREAAEAYTIAPLEAQEALLDDWAARAPHKLDDAFAIRAALRGDAMVASEPVAKFLTADAERLEAYLAAGGRVLDDLFAERPGLRDPRIAIRVANDFLRKEAERVAAAEGWGFGLAKGDRAVFGGMADPPFTDDEDERLNKIDDALEEEGADYVALNEERETIFATATLRAFPLEERTRAGVEAWLNSEGLVCFSRGVELPDDTANLPGGDRPESPPGGKGEMLTMADEQPDNDNVPKPLGDPGKQLLAVIHAGATTALRDAVRQRPDIAMMLAVAALGCQYGVYGASLRPVQSHEPEDNELLKRIRPLNFPDALAACAEASTCDLTVAFARIVAAGIETQGVSFDAIGVLFRSVAARGGDVTGALSRTVDRRAFFEAAEKERTLRVIGALVGPAEAGRVKGWKKDKLAEYAATLSKEQGHLPPPFSNWMAFPTRPGALDEAIYSERETPLAEAMREAIDADEGKAAQPARGAKKQADPFDAKIAEACSAYPALGQFLRSQVHFGNEALDAGRLKASELYEAYSSFAQANKSKQAALREFGEVIAAIGVEKKRFKTGVHYLNIALRDPQPVMQGAQ